MPEPLPAPNSALGPLRRNPEYDPTPMATVTGHAGATVEIGLFTHVQPVTLSPSPDGLTRVPLTPPTRAVAAPDLGDVRLIDADNRQWPYVLERGHGESESVPMPQARHSHHGESHYVLTLPAPRVNLTGLTVSLARSYVDRKVRVQVTRDDGEVRTVYRGRLRRTQERAAPFAMDLGPVQVRGVEIIVADGDNAPLTLTGVLATIQGAHLIVTAPAGEYRLLVGRPDALPADYELARMRDRLANLEAGTIRAGVLTANPAYRPAKRLAEGDMPWTLLMWGALGLAVLVLGAVTLRAARKL